MLAGTDRGRQMRGLLSVPCHGHEVGQPGQGRRQEGLAQGLRRLHMTVHISMRKALAWLWHHHAL